MTVKLMEENEVHAFESFSDHPVVASFSTRDHNMRFREDAQGSENDRAAFLERLGIPPAGLVCPDQVHSANILLVSEEMSGRGAVCRENAVGRADGMLVKAKSVPLGVQTADCASLFFYDPRQGAAAIAHVGWRGLYAGMPEKMVAAICNNFLSRPRDLKIGLGPMIRRCCYEVGQDVAFLFQKHVSTRKGKKYLDLARAIGSSLRQAGVKKTQIEDPGFCTSCRSDLFYSYRREGQSAGRMLSVIMLQ
ncbi:MAG: laccase domain-containing protein [Candidatus Omnitrophica bacterium]|nr:laccase domain-containing protein [Candidatus Omnitrophota bacterium]